MSNFSATTDCSPHLIQELGIAVSVREVGIGAYAMEQYLNALWLLLSLSLVGAWIIFRTRSSRRTSTAKALTLDLAILACSVALLFPAISMSDDLQCEDNAVVESWRAAEKPVFVKAVVESGYVIPCLPQLLDPSPPVYPHSLLAESEQLRASSSSLILIRVTRAPPIQIF